MKRIGALLATPVIAKRRESETDGRLHEVAAGYIAFVEELPGANTQRETLVARRNPEEAVKIVLDANRETFERSLAGANVIGESTPCCSIRLMAERAAGQIVGR